MPRPKKVALTPIDHYEVRDAANTIARAREHMDNPRLMKAVKAHVDGLSAAVSGGLAPKKPRPTAKRKGDPWG